MPQIQLLDEATIEKIAAGEVVERPSSVVKELVENAIDAKATSITVEIKEGGLSLIRITDNGCGIERDQIRLAFLRHSTSKIRSLNDLLRIKSLGFRGEALASISAVAQVELITKPHGALTGVRFITEGSKEKLFEEVGAPDGTTFLVRNLFFNTPVRRKFLKSAQTEGGYVAAILEHLALSHPDISFQLIVNNKQKLHTTGNDSRRDVIFQLYGKEIASNLLPVDVKNKDLHITGLIGKPLLSRGNRDYENYYVNGRFFKSTLLARAIEQAYKPYLMSHQYPFTVLYISMDEELLDVNVHPTKMEVRFSDEKLVYDALYQAISDALREPELIPKVRLDTIANAVAKDSPYERKYEPLKRQIPWQEPAVPKTDKPDDKKPQENRQLDLTDVCCETSSYQAGFIKQVQQSKVRLIGQLFDTYWLAQSEDTFYLIDQHAAHEKVLFERNMASFQTREFTSQQLSPPIILSLSMQEQQALENNIPALTSLGFEIESFGGREYALVAIPDNLYHLDARALFLELLDHFKTLPSTQPLTTEMIWDKVAQASCKAAIKGNQSLSYPEAEALIRELLTLQNPYQCPHGRPTMIQLSKYEIEKKFKRIL